MDRHGALSRNDAHWSLEEELRGKRAIQRRWAAFCKA